MEVFAENTTSARAEFSAVWSRSSVGLLGAPGNEGNVPSGARLEQIGLHGAARQNLGRHRPTVGARLREDPDQGPLEGLPGAQRDLRRADDLSGGASQAQAQGRRRVAGVDGPPV